MLGIIIGFLVLLILIIYRVSIVIAAPISSIIIALFNNLDILQILNENYLPGFAGFIQKYLFIFLLSSLLGKIMEDSNDASDIGKTIIKFINYKYVGVGIFFISALMTYGGISGFVLIFTIYPIAKSVFENANLSKSLILASITGGVVVIGIPLAGSPQIQNLIMMDLLNTPAVAGLYISLISVFFSTGFAVYYLIYKTKKLLPDDIDISEKNIMSELNITVIIKLLLSISPLLTVFISLAILDFSPVVSLLFGVIVSLIKNIKKINFKKVINDCITNATVPLMFVASVMGFGNFISNLPVFKEYLQMILNLPLHPYFLIGIITNIASGLLGSASGGIILTMSTVGDNLVKLVNVEYLHRIILIASTGLDTLPHNSVYLAMLAYTGLKLKDTYYDYVILTIIAPSIALFVATFLAIYI
ncbi:MAG: GntP family permease [Halanaerobiales bacterium]|nr:GntP family permease [Halanaerobiales bacterium]